MRQCGTSECKCPMAGMDEAVAVVLRASHLVESGLITMRDMDHWVLTGVEHLHRERSRYQKHYREQKQPNMQRKPGEID